MSLQSDPTLPQLADNPSLKTTTVLLDVGSRNRGIRRFARRARTPNLLYAAIAALAIGALAFAMDGAIAAIVAALVAVPLLRHFALHLAGPDACLLARVRDAFAGALSGLNPRASRGGKAIVSDYTLWHRWAPLASWPKERAFGLARGRENPALLTSIIESGRWKRTTWGRCNVGLVGRRIRGPARWQREMP